MIDKEKAMALHKDMQGALKDALLPLMSDKRGIVAARVFYVVEDETGERTAGQAGITPIGREGDAMLLIRSIMALLLDVEKNAERSLHEGPKKH